MRFAIRELVLLPGLMVLSCRSQVKPPAVETPAPLVGGDAAATTAPAAQAVPADAPSTPQTAAEHLLGDMRIRLFTEASDCWLALSPPKGEPTRIQLDLKPPCYVLLWQASATPRAKADRQPIGGAGAPMAWRYGRGPMATTAMAVIGDDILGDLRVTDRLVAARERGYHCAGSAQGVMIRAGSVTKVPKRNQVGIFCVEVPIDEASFWLTTHAPK